MSKKYKKHLFTLTLIPVGLTRCLYEYSRGANSRNTGCIETSGRVARLWRQRGQCQPEQTNRGEARDATEKAKPTADQVPVGLGLVPDRGGRRLALTGWFDRSAIGTRVGRARYETTGVDESNSM